MTRVFCCHEHPLLRRNPHRIRVRVRRIFVDTPLDLGPEVAQEAFVRAHRALGGFPGDAKLSTWLHPITSRLCLNRLASGERRLTRQCEDALLRLSDAGPRRDVALERR